MHYKLFEQMKKVLGKDERLTAEGEYFPEYVGVDLNSLNPRRGSVYVKKAKDGILDVIVNVKNLW